MIVRSNLSFVYTFGDTLVFPGVNNLPSDIGEQFKSSPLVEPLIKQGKFTFDCVDIPENVDSLVDAILKASTSKAAIDLVSGTLQLNVLKQVKEAETRRNVIAAVEAKIAELTVERKSE